MCGECSQRRNHTRFAPAHGACAFLVYTAQAPGCTAGELSKAGPGFRALPRSFVHFRFRFLGTPQRHRLSLAYILYPSQVRAAQVTRCLASALSQVVSVSYSPPRSQLLDFLGAPQECCLRCAMCLLWGADLWLRPSWQMSTVLDPRKTWLATGKPAHNLVEDAVSGAEIDPCLPALAVAHLPLCLQWGDRPVHSPLALLWYSLNPLFCEQTRLCLRLELLAEKFSLSLSFSSLAIPQFGLLSHVNFLRLSLGHSGPVPTLYIQPAPPCSAPAHCWQT